MKEFQSNPAFVEMMESFRSAFSFESPEAAAAARAEGGGQPPILLRRRWDRGWEAGVLGLSPGPGLAPEGT